MAYRGLYLINRSTPHAVDLISDINVFLRRLLRSLGMPTRPEETDSLLPSIHDAVSARQAKKRDNNVLFTSIFSLIVFGLIWLATFYGHAPWSNSAKPLPADLEPLERAKALLERNPLIDGVSL